MDCVLIARVFASLKLADAVCVPSLASPKGARKKNLRSACHMAISSKETLLDPARNRRTASLSVSRLPLYSLSWLNAVSRQGASSVFHQSGRPPEGTSKTFSQGVASAVPVCGHALRPRSARWILNMPMFTCFIAAQGRSSVRDFSYYDASAT